MSCKVRKGFTLIETGVAALVGVSLVGALAPPGRQARISQRGISSQANLGQIGAGAAMYGLDHAGRIPGYSWRGPDDGEDFVVYTMPNGSSRVAYSHAEAAALQEEAILLRNTGRIDGPHRILRSDMLLAPRHMPHLPLQEYLGLPFPSPLFADPADAKQLQWQANPFDITAANDIPYAIGSDYGPQHHSPGSFTEQAARQRWAYKSSYETVPAAYSPDGSPTLLPLAGSSYLFLNQSDVRFATGRTFDEVRFPSAKVHMYEEFDRERNLAIGGRWFGSFNSAPSKLMFDGSIDDQLNWRATPSYRPDQPHKSYQPWTQVYTPLHEFPRSPAGWYDNTLHNMYWRWTLFGLQGSDYAQRISAPGS